MTGGKMKGWSMKNQLNNPLGYLKRITKDKLKFWKKINKLSSNYEEANLSCSILEKYERRLKKIKQLK